MRTAQSAPAANEITIFGKLIESGDRALFPPAARYILSLAFSAEEKDRMRELLAKAQESSLTPAEEIEMQSYELVGHLLSIWKSKARKALKQPRRRSS